MSKRIIPGYSPPFEDELLSSFLFRLSYNHSIKPFSFTKYYFQSDILWTRDIDKYIIPSIKEQLKEITPLTINDIENLQLSSYQDLVYNNDINSSFTSGISNLGIYHRKRKAHALYACPNCLELKPYFKKSWRLLTSIICTNCNIHLIDACPQCSSPIIFQRVDIGSKNIYNNHPIYLCWNCSFDLRKTTQTLATTLEIEYQHYINKSINLGYNNHSQYSFLYIKVLLIFLNKINTKSKNWNRVKNAIIKEYLLEKDITNLTFNIQSISNRILLLPIIYKLLQKWPINFVLFCKKNKIRYSDFSKDNNDIPYWFYKAFKEEF